MNTFRRTHLGEVVLSIVVFVVIVIGIILLAYDTAYSQPQFAQRCRHQLTLTDTVETRVIAIVDGDTFKVWTQVIDSVLIEGAPDSTPNNTSRDTVIRWQRQRRDTIVSVRVVGVDTFERQISQKLRRQAHDAGISLTEALQRGVQARRFAVEWLLDKDVILCRDPRTPKQDLYCRPLYRVWLVGIDGQMVEYAALVRRAGLADVYSRWHDADTTETTPKR